jgi:hypothetical protein
MKPQKFHLGDVLSITTGILLSPDKMFGVSKIMNFMVNEDLDTLALPIFAEQCSEEILKQHPQLKEINTSGVDSTNCDDWLKKQIIIYGEYLEINPNKSRQFGS